MKNISLIVHDFGINITMAYISPYYDWYPTFAHIFDSILAAPAPTREEMIGPCGTGTMSVAGYMTAWTIEIREQPETPSPSQQRVYDDY